MQRECLERWMVKQIEDADLAKETVLQLPVHTNCVTLFTPPAASNDSTAVEIVEGRKPPQRLHGAFVLPTSSSGRKAHPLTRDATSGLDQQWRAHFDRHGNAHRVESGRVDRTKVLCTMSQHLLNDDDENDDNGDEGGRQEPLFLWDLPRGHIVAYIRQSVLPSSWAMSTKLTGEWEAVAAADPEDDAANASPRDVLHVQIRLCMRFMTPYDNQTASACVREIRENKRRVQSPRLATTLEEKYVLLSCAILQSRLADHHACMFATRKEQAEDRMARNKRQREQLVCATEVRLEAQRLTYQLRVAACTKHNSNSISSAAAAASNPPRSAEERARALSVRRHKVWLVTVAFAVVTKTWFAKFTSSKQLVHIAAQTIQRLWRAWKWRCHASKPSVVLCAWLRRFMVDQCSGSRERRNFNRMMVMWRSNVIHSQRFSQDFVFCTRARLHAFSMWWDRIDHERQRQERHAHERSVPLTGEREAEWHATLHARRLVNRPSSQCVNSLTGASAATTSAARPSVRGNGNGGTLLQLESMNEKLTSLQRVLTPIEIQWLQQHAFHVVRIAKSTRSSGYARATPGKLIQPSAPADSPLKSVNAVVCNREVRLDDARAIVQNSLSWGSLTVDRCVGPPTSSNSGAVCVQRPVLSLFAGDAARQRMEELMRRGVQLTLERDAEQRQVLDASTALGSSPKKREPSSNGKDAVGGMLLTKRRQLSRRLGFLLPFFRDAGASSNSAPATGSSTAAASATMASESVHEATDEVDE
ncbi:hypothetical protein FI667_g7221, partial [Globisporangium splendens]